jgi:predicted CopG family antitoxin
MINMARARDESKTSRNIALKLETYERLDKYKARLMGEKGTTNVSFDDVIISLLDSKKGST